MQTVDFGPSQWMKTQLLMTFNTPWGQYCFTKMPFGLNQAQYFFQFYMNQHFQDMNTTTVIADDIMIHGENDAQHDKHLLQVLNKCQEIGLILNPDKCTFGETSVKFYGNTISKDGLRPDPDKLDIILKMPTPSNNTELSLFLGMCNYLSPYISSLSNITAPLRQLIKKTVKFTWNLTYDRSSKRPNYTWQMQQL